MPIPNDARFSTGDEWFLVDNLTIIKTYNETHDLKIVIAKNRSIQEFIPAKNLTSFSIESINWSSVNGTIKNLTSYKFLGSQLPKHYDQMRGKITENGLSMEYHCDNCFLGDCPLFLEVTCEEHSRA